MSDAPPDRTPRSWPARSLINAAFCDAGLAASFVGAVLSGASFTGAPRGVNFANAAITQGNGSLPVPYCKAEGLMPRPAGSPEPVNHAASTGLDLTTLQPMTILPNGCALASARALGLTLTRMLTAAGAPANRSAGTLGGGMPRTTFSSPRPSRAAPPARKLTEPARAARCAGRKCNPARDTIPSPKRNTGVSTAA